MARARRDVIAELSAAIRTITGHPPTARAREQFARYLDLLLEWNRVHRLTGFESPADVAEKLFLDSALFLPFLPPGPLRLVDIGAGAGIPGVPLRLLDPRICLTLIESRRKRVSFLATVRRELAIEDVQIVHGRAEDLVVQDTELYEQFDVAVMRAVSRSRELLGAVRSSLRLGGTLIASGPPRGQTPDLDADGFRIEVKQVDYPRIGVSRRFLVGLRES